MTEVNGVLQRGNMKRVARLVSYGLAVAVIASGATWAVTTLTQPTRDPTAAQSFTYATVQQGEVGATISLNAIAAWKPQPAGINQATGTVTSVAISAGDEVFVGDVLYSVNLRPVVVAQGDVPAFRALSRDMEGADVAQLQSMLQALGFYGGTADGSAGPATEKAIRAWQHDRGTAETGTVELGDITFVPTLPSRVSLDDEKVSPGKALVGGESIIQALPSTPDFLIPVAPGQASMMPPGTPVSIASPAGETWEARTAEQHVDAESKSVDVVLTGLDGNPVCREACGSIPVVGSTTMPSIITTAQTVAGLTVPSAALVTDAEGTVSVISSKGKRMAVSVVAAAKGMSVIEGVAEGVRVRLPAKADQTP